MLPTMSKPGMRRRGHGLVDEQLDERPGDRGHDVGDGLPEVARGPQVLTSRGCRSTPRPAGEAGDRAGLHDRELAVAPGPLHVHRHAEQLLDPRSQLGQLDGLRLVEDRSIAQLVGHGPIFGPGRACGPS